MFVVYSVNIYGVLSLIPSLEICCSTGLLHLRISRTHFLCPIRQKVHGTLPQRDQKAERPSRLALVRLHGSLSQHLPAPPEPERLHGRRSDGQVSQLSGFCPFLPTTIIIGYDRRPRVHCVCVCLPQTHSAGGSESGIGLALRKHHFQPSQTGHSLRQAGIRAHAEVP